MQINCPYCQSGNVIHCRYLPHNQPAANSGVASSASFAAIGVSLSKTLPLTVPPVIGGLAGMVVGGLLGNLFDEPKRTQSTGYSYFYCQACHRDFQ